MRAGQRATRPSSISNRIEFSASSDVPQCSRITCTKLNITKIRRDVGND